MNHSLADQYYLQALENYPWNLTDVLIALGYALSYDDEHPQAHCLMGRLLMEKVKDYQAAAHHFEVSLLHAPEYVDTYKYYSLLLIWLGDFQRAEALIRKGLRVPGMDTVALKYNRAVLHESRGDLDLVVIQLRHVISIAPHLAAQEYLERELDRVERKRNLSVRTEDKVLMH